MKFRYHQPIPNFYNKENPKKPKTTITTDSLKKLEDLILDTGFIGVSYSKLSDDFKKEWGIDWDNILILKYCFSEDILKMDDSKEKCRLEDEEFQKYSFKTFKIADYLRENGYIADLINPLDDRVSLRAIAMQSNEAVILQNNMCMFQEGVNLGFNMIKTSVENLPFKTVNTMEWVHDYCSTCGICIDRCPENAFDSEGKVLRKICTAHRNGCSKCITICPFYKQGYDKIKKRYDKKCQKKSL